MENLVARAISDEKPQKILLLSKGVREIIMANPRLQVVNAGIRVFQSVQGEVMDYRLVQAGLSAIAPFISKRLVQIQIEDLMMLLVYEDPLFHTFTQVSQDRFKPIDVGSCVFVVTFEESPMHFVGWRGKASCKLLMTKNERNLMLQYFQAQGISMPIENTTTKKNVVCTKDK